MIGQIFDFQGRTDRASWWTVNVLTSILFGLFLRYSFLSNEVSNLGDLYDKNRGAGVAFTCGFLFFQWIFYCNNVRRFHDRGKSGWYGIVFLTPYIPTLFGLFSQSDGQDSSIPVMFFFYSVFICAAMWLLVELGFLKGTIGPNKYGDRAMSIFEGMFGTEGVENQREFHTDHSTSAIRQRRKRAHYKSDSTESSPDPWSTAVEYFPDIKRFYHTIETIDPYRAEQFKFLILEERDFKNSSHVYRAVIEEIIVATCGNKNKRARDFMARSIATGNLADVKRLIRLSEALGPDNITSDVFEKFKRTIS